MIIVVAVVIIVMVIINSADFFTHSHKHSLPDFFFFFVQDKKKRYMSARGPIAPWIGWQGTQLRQAAWFVPYMVTVGPCEKACTGALKESGVLGK
jgi:hypothetical protein